MFDKKAYMKEYYLKNKDKVLKVSKEWAKNNLEKSRAIITKWRKNNPEKVKEYRIKRSEKIVQWWLENPEYMERWRQKNKSKIKKYGKLYYQTIEGKASKQRGDSKRRVREGNIINTLTAEEWINILKEYKFRCAYCGKEFTLFNRATRDHVIPVSKGGNNTKDNVVPACKSCNSKKHDKMLLRSEL